MRTGPSGPSIVPTFDVTVYLVLDDFGQLGRVYLETEEEKADLETVVIGLLRGEYKKPVRVVAFNTSEGWSRDVSEEVAWEVLTRASNEGLTLTDATHDFVAYHAGEDAALRYENSH
jgi:hypothetical protein